jgi:hypothetical protein
MKRSLVVGLVVFAAAAYSSTAHADGGFYGYGFPWFGYGNQGPAAYALGNIPAPPYFALHPPVYYSHPVARTYGRSPFACPCDCHHPSRQSVVRVIANPYVPATPAKPSDTPAAGEGKVAAKVERIANPYYLVNATASRE